MMYFCVLYLLLHIGFVTSDAICSCTINDANIYEAPSHSSKVISLLKTGGCLKHDTKQNDISWTKVLIREVTGYIHKDLAVQTKCNMPASDTEHNQKRADFCMSENCLNCRCHQGTGHHCGDCHTCNHHDTVVCPDWINKVDGSWGAWQSWGTCTVTCGGGNQKRTRLCNNPPKQTQFGKDCAGDSEQNQICNTNHCPIDGGWSAWSAYSVCSVTCGGGDKVRSRTCTMPAPNYGGAPCHGQPLDVAHCNTQGCPVDGGWSAFNAFSTCSATCGGGTMTRQRICNNPSPINGGAVCAGSALDTVTCNDQQCPVDGGWSAWASWIACTNTCGGGIQLRYRLCDNPKPMHNGKECPGDKTENRTCSTNPCPVDGGWSSWTAYLPCSAKCGSHNGFSYRSRHCNNPAPQYHGMECYGDKYQYKPCAADCSSTTAKPTIKTTTQRPTTTSQMIQVATTTPSPTTPNIPSSVATSTHSCDKIGLIHALGSNQIISHSLASSCSDGSPTSPEAIVIEYCLMGRITSWTKGIKVIDACKQNILTTQFVPVSSYENGRITQFSGIFMGCVSNGFKIAMQLCSHPVAIYHIYNSTAASGILDPNNYYIVN